MATRKEIEMNSQISEELGSYVMSVLTGTITGHTMDVDEVCVGIVRNGWAEPEGLPASVVAELERLREQGSVQQSGDGYRRSDSVVASILGQLDDAEGEASA